MMHRACHVLHCHQSRHSVIRASQTIQHRSWMLTSLSTNTKLVVRSFACASLGDFDSISLEKNGHLFQGSFAQDMDQETSAAFVNAFCVSLQAVLAGLQVIIFVYSLCACSWVCNSSPASHRHSDTARCAGSTDALPHGSSKIKLHICMC